MICLWCGLSPNGGRLVSGSMDRTVELWNVQTGAVLRAMAGHSDWFDQSCTRTMVDSSRRLQTIRQSEFGTRQLVCKSACIRALGVDSVCRILTDGVR